jgi:hypothetical protein
MTKSLVELSPSTDLTSQQTKKSVKHEQHEEYWLGVLHALA